MNLKAKLTSLIIAFLLLASLLVVGVLAFDKESFKIEGNILFDVEGIEARIELVSLENGSLNTTDYADQTGKFKTIEINNDMSKSAVERALESWKGLELQFDTPTPDPITMQIKITNLAVAGADNYIELNVATDYSASENCEIIALNNAGGAAAVIAPQQNSTFTVTFKVVGEGYKASLDGFVVDFNMEKKAKADFPTSATGMTFAYVDNSTKDALQVAWDGTTAFTETAEIPAYVTFEDKILPVTRLADNAFKDCSSLTSVTIPSSVISIEAGAFWNCTSLTSVIIPSGVTSIGNNTFDQCRNLESVTLSPNLTNIGNHAFIGCTNLANITIPNSVTSIGRNAFQNCKNFTNITIPEGVESLIYSFNNCSKLQNVIINSKNLALGEYAFNNCYSLKSIIIQGVITSIGNCAFQSCTALESITIPNTVISIGDNAFNDCASIESIVIPKSVQSLGTYVFKNNKKLTSVILEEGVATLGVSIFSGCDKLETIRIPSTLANLDDAFRGCNGLKNIKIPSTVTSINGAFTNCTGLKSVIIPASVETIGESAFEGCTALDNVYISTGVKTIKANAFKGATIQTMYIPSTVTTIEAGAFAQSDSSTGSIAGVYYFGTVTQWNSVSLGDNNTMISNNLHFNHYPDKTSCNCSEINN